MEFATAKTATEPGQKSDGSDSATSPASSFDPNLNPLPELPVFLQARLHVSQPGDPSEEEADRFAAGRISAARQAPAAGGFTAPESVRPNGPGQRLPEWLQKPFEERLGLDLSPVRLHTDDTAAAKARSIGAQAFTSGHDVVFGAGQYRPHTEAGQGLLAHELAHVAQQQQGVPASAPPAFVQRHCDAATASCPDAPPMDPMASTLTPEEIENWTNEQVTHGIEAASSGLGILILSQDARRQATRNLQLLLQAAHTRSLPIPGGLQDTAVCTAPSDFDFIQPETCPAPPAEPKTEIQVQGPSLNPGEKKTDTFVVPDRVLSQTPILLYAIPLALVQPDESGDPLNQCVVPGSPQSLAPLGPFSQQPYTPSFLTVDPAPKPQPQAVVVAGQTVAVEAVVGEYAIVSQYHQYAVGAGAVTIVETAQGVRIFDAGVGNEGGSALAEATMQKIKAAVGNRPILEIVISHLHEDHTNLMPRIAREFPVGRIRVSAVQYADPRFKDILAEFAREQEAGVRQRAALEFDSRRGAWENAEGAKIADVALREQAFQGAKATHVSDAVRALHASPTQLDLLVPNQGKFEIVSAPLGGVLPEPTGTAEPVSEGLRRAGVPGDISVTSLTDPAAGKTLTEFRKEQSTKPGLRIDDTVIDQTSAGYIIDLPNGGRLIFAPDVRTDDLRRTVKDSSGNVRANFEAELAKLGHPAKFQAWNMTHHMQSGWVAGGAPHVVGVGELVRFTELMVNIHSMQAAQAPAGSPGVSNVVSVSVQGDPTNFVTRSLVNPGMVWFLRSLGFEVFLATSGRDIRMIEALTPGGQRVAGVAGLPYEGLRPTEPLLLQSEAALRHLRQKVDLENARKRTPKMKKAEYEQLVADRTANLDRLNKAITELEAARAKYIEEVSSSTWRGAHDGKPAADAVAPDPAKPLPKAIADAEARVRTAMGAADLSDFTKPTAAEAPIISETALVLLRMEGQTALGNEARAVLEANRRADVLREKIHSGQGDATAKAELIQELGTLRGLLEQQIETAPEASKTVLREELSYAQREIESLRSSVEGTLIFSREPGTGRLIENKVVRVPATEPAKPTSADRARAAAEKGGRVLGAVMVLQTIRGQEELAARVKSGEATIGQGVVGTVHNIQGISIGVRMMSGIHVNPGEFVVMSILDITQTAMGDYDAPEQAAVAISQSVIRQGLTLITLAISSAMMKSNNPYVVIAGALLFVVVEPIMAFLDWLGVFDWIERRTAFLPSEVTEANQDLRKLVTEYRGIIGALELRARSDRELQALGASDPAAVRTAASDDIKEYLGDAASKEATLLSTFREAYTRAKDDFAGLYELDDLRKQFLELRAKAHQFDQGGGNASPTTALSTFAEIDSGLSLDAYTEQQVHDMPLWEKLHDEIGEMEDELDEEDVDDVDWDDVREDQQQVEQILRTARYRLNPVPFGMRSKPLLSPGTPARAAYESKLLVAELRMAHAQRKMVNRLTGVAIPAPALPAQFAQAPGIFGFTAGSASPVVTAESFLPAFGKLMDAAPARPFTAEQLYSHSMDMGPAYRVYLRDNDKYSDYIERLRSTETAMMAAYGAALRSAGPGDRDRLLNLKDKIDGAVSRRTDQLALLYKDELDSRLAKIREREVDKLAPALGDDKSLKPLSEEEEYALKEGSDLDDFEYDLSTVRDRLEKVPGLRIPDSDDGYVDGVFRVVGDIDSIDLFILSIPRGGIDAEDNVLVGVSGEGHEVTTGMGHMQSYPVVALNAEAVNHLGTGPRSLQSRYLRPVKRIELLPAMLKKK